MENFHLDKVSRRIIHFIVHCADTYEDMDIGWDWIDSLHKKKGWKMGGYNFFIKRDGTLEIGRPLTMTGAHTLGKNTNSIGVCFAGGKGKDNKPENNANVDQIATLIELFYKCEELYPGIKISGHNQHNVTMCPVLDVREYASKHGLKESQILQNELKVNL